ncbi:unnamed protein product [Moneuplotes crassus]|uniref:Uncharacterized protein n=1 Tax=Euplotes crassus TaxID=5936 RepID=A0AAD1Y2U4_EUPCR|nr:unnamed protein product [Moneuplotes crassus]
MCGIWCNSRILGFVIWGLEDAVPKLSRGLDIKQKTGELREFGFDYESCFRSYWVPIFGILLIWLFHVSVRIFFIYYGFVCFISVVEFKRRKGCELVPQSDDPDNKPKDVEEQIYGEIFASIDKSPHAAFHQPLVMGRIMIIVAIILVINIYNESTIWMVLCVILILQIGYIYQAIKILKFAWWPLKVIYLINEVFLLAFICVFGILRTRYDWRNLWKLNSNQESVQRNKSCITQSEENTSENTCQCNLRLPLVEAQCCHCNIATQFPQDTEETIEQRARMKKKKNQSQRIQRRILRSLRDTTNYLR